MQPLADMIESVVDEDTQRCMRVAVYGTLRTGMSNHGLLRNATSLGTFTLKGYKLYVMSASTFDTIPFIVPAKEEETTVEVFELPESWEQIHKWTQLIENLDLLEDHPNWYTRTAVTINGAPTWVYAFLDAVATQYLAHGDIQPVPTGDWVKPVAEREEAA